MSQDIVSDLMNNMMNAKKAGKTSIVATSYSKLLLNILDIMKQYLDSFYLLAIFFEA